VHYAPARLARLAGVFRFTPSKSKASRVILDSDMSEFTDYLQDVFSQFGDISTRRMFGGHGVYFDDCMFGLVAEDTLYLKVDQENIHFFNELDLPPFTFEKTKGGTMSMSFHLAPELIFEDHDEAALWAGHAWAAAKRAKLAKTGKKKAKKKSKKKSPVKRSK